MVKKLKYLLFLIPFFTILNVDALTMSELRMYYTDYNGDTYNTSSTSTAQWGGYSTTFINHNFGGGYMFDQPASLYAFFNSGQGCSNKSCILSGVFVAKTENSYSGNTLSSIRIQIEQNGVYKSCSTVGLSTEYGLYSYLSFQCSSYNLNAGFNIVFYDFSAPTTTFIKYGLALNDFTIVESATTDDVIVNDNRNTQSIINSQNSNTQNIINNQDSNTQDIIDNQNDNTQDIIDNQNSNTQQQIESQKVCTSYDKGSVKHSSKILDNNGELVVASASWGVTDFIPITKNYSMQIKQNYSGTSNAYLCFYDDTKTKISCQLEQNTPINTDITIPNNASYFRYSIVIFSNVPQLEVCSNGNQALNDSLNNLNDTLNSESTPNTNQDIQDMEDMTASDTPISDLITMPLTLFNAYINGVNSTCSPVNLGNLYGTNLILPCLNLEQRLGSNLWGIIDAFFSIFMCYNIGMLFITAFEGITSLRDDFDSLYQPRHSDTGYQPKHGGGN